MRGRRWDEWRTLTEVEQLDAARIALAEARAAGRRFDELRLGTFGPPLETERVALARDVDLDATFALVPGGTLTPGLDAQGMRAFWAIERAWLSVLGNTNDHEQPYTATRWSPGSLARRPPVEIGAMWVALAPLSASALGTEPPRFSARPVLAFEAASAAARRLGYELPTSDELEWATTRDVPTLFYWGNELPDGIDPRTPPPEEHDAWEELNDDFAARYMDLGDDVDAPWPTTNRFGLQGAAGQPVWCRGPRGEAWVAGGAKRFFPWQGCGEWLWLLSSLRVDAKDIPRHHGAMLRPILRLPG